MNSIKKSWKEASTLMLLARDKTLPNNDFDYKVLVFKRTAKTSFMPNSICFAGGKVDPDDESTEWLKFYEKFKVSNEQLKKEFNNFSEKKAFIYHNKSLDSLNREIALKITAIRETFEELGVAVCQKSKTNIKFSAPFSNFLEKFDVEWQRKVHDQDSSFLKFCEEHNVLPDLWNVFEWSTWMTPTYFRARRFETAFYLVALNEQPDIYPEPHEVAEHLWETPQNLLDMFKKQELWLPPPQCYELTRLCFFKKLDDLMNFAQKREKSGNTLIMPVQFKTSDGFMHILPGDDLYPEKPNYNEVDHDVEKYQDKTMAEMRAIAKNLHRGEIKGLYEMELFCNIHPLDGHINPYKTPSKL